MTIPTTFNGKPYYHYPPPLVGLMCPYCRDLHVTYCLAFLQYHAAFVRAVRDAPRPLELGSAAHATNTSYANAFRASNWGLITSAVPGGERGPWIITQLGLAFLAGTLQVPALVGYRAREVLWYAGIWTSVGTVPVTRTGIPGSDAYEYYRNMKRSNIVFETTSKKHVYDIMPPLPPDDPVPPPPPPPPPEDPPVPPPDDPLPANPWP